MELSDSQRDDCLRGLGGDSNVDMTSSTDENEDSIVEGHSSSPRYLESTLASRQRSSLNGSLDNASREKSGMQSPVPLRNKKKDKGSRSNSTNRDPVDDVLKHVRITSSSQSLHSQKALKNRYQDLASQTERSERRLTERDDSSRTTSQQSGPAPTDKRSKDHTLGINKPLPSKPIRPPPSSSKSYWTSLNAWKEWGLQWESEAEKQNGDAKSYRKENQALNEENRNLMNDKRKLLDEFGSLQVEIQGLREDGHTLHIDKTKLEDEFEALQVENQRLQKEGHTLQAEYQSLKDSALQRDRDLKRIQGDLNKMQGAGLQRVDRFTPQFDAKITSMFENIWKKVDSIARTQLAKAESSLAGDEWLDQVLEYSYPDSYDPQSIRATKLSRGLRRELLSGVLWRFLDDDLFASPFLAFGGNTARVIEKLWGLLFPTPLKSEDSAKWRVMTVQRLDEFNKPELDAQVKSKLFDGFKVLVKALGYLAMEDESTRKLEASIGDLFDKAIEFGQMLSGERAVLQLCSPKFSAHGQKKAEDDAFLTNMHDMHNGEQEEREGRVSFLISPALVKRGTAMGANLDTEWSVLVKALAKLQPAEDEDEVL